LKEKRATEKSHDKKIHFNLESQAEEKSWLDVDPRDYSKRHTMMKERKQALARRASELKRNDGVDVRLVMNGVRVRKGAKWDRAIGDGFFWHKKTMKTDEKGANAQRKLGSLKTNPVHFRVWDAIHDSEVQMTK